MMQGCLSELCVLCDVYKMWCVEYFVYVCMLQCVYSEWCGM